MRKSPIETLSPWAIEKMKGYGDKFKIRLGDYRIGLTISAKDKYIIF